MICKYPEVFCWKNVSSFCSAKLLTFFQQKISEYCILNPLKQLSELEMCQYDTDVPAQGPSSTTRRYFAKKWSEKRAITLIIIGRFYPKSNLTIFYDYIPGTNQSFFKKISVGKHLLKVKKAITPIIMGWIYPTWNLTSILWLYTCVLNLNSIHLCFQKISNWNYFSTLKKGCNSKYNWWILP